MTISALVVVMSLIGLVAPNSLFDLRSKLITERFYKLDGRANGATEELDSRVNLADAVPLVAKLPQL